MLYKITYNNRKKYYYAWKDTSFLEFRSSICEQCDRIVGSPVFANTCPELCLEEGSVFPDFLQFTGAGNRYFFISGRTAELFQQYGITGYIDHGLAQIVSVRPNRGNDVPAYHCLEITGKVEFDFKTMQLKKKRICPLCNQFDWNRTRSIPIVLDKSTWDGSDLCTVQSEPGVTICSDRMIDVVKKYNLTGLDIQEIERRNC